MTAINEHEALIFAMVTMSAVDRKMTDAELASIADVVRHLPAFRGFDVDRLVDVAEDCGERLGDETGLEQILDIIADTLPRRLYETAYACAVEVAAADLKVTDEEIRLLELLRDRLGLDKLTTAAIERSARARHQTV
jgi:tellurite resistance protein